MSAAAETMTMSSIERQVNRTNKAELARELGLTRTHVSRVLSGRSNPSLNMAADIARKLGVSLDDFHGYLQKAAVN